MGEPSFEHAVDEFITRLTCPRRLREPRVADHLAKLDPATVPTPDGRVAAWRVGAGPAVLLVHGFEDDNSLWSPLIDELVEHGRALVAFDLPAHGASEGTRCMTWEVVDAVDAVADALGPIDAVVAHSFACGGVLAALAEGFTVDRAVFVASPALMTVRGKGDRWDRHGARLGLPDEVVQAARAKYNASIGAGRAAFDAQATANSTSAELLVLHSTDDERMPFAPAEAAIRSLPRVQFVVLHGLNHRRTARDPDVVHRIAEFVSPPSGEE